MPLLALGNVDGKALTSAMGSCSENAFIAVTGPQKYVGPKLEEAGIEYTEFSWKERGESLWEEADPKGYKKYIKKKEKADAKKAKEAEEAEAAGEEAEAEE